MIEVPSEVTRLLRKVEGGNCHASADLLPLVYEELRLLASRHMATERSDHTLQATALVHDAYLRLVGSDSGQGWDSRAHFFAAAAKAMRRILIEHARSKASLKRGGDRDRVEVGDLAEFRAEITPEQLLELDDALVKLGRVDEQAAELVRLRLYAGLTVAEAAKVMEISRTVAYERWDYAVSWFTVELAAGF
ncbi:ECF-type sigma factor [Stieleria sp. ICT_E10.1]|uniref:ECF-type sigma factor n=1 Tax=Stieleria sedimenti TaxID=2976331 RepID=UPI0021805302|nr:ECF-type sigma factor [Stieleria sedimenti]MCS7465547.1 ECF-type sigma factor [Stieleria sedimenti]